MGSLPVLDPIVHGQVRLAILSLLSGAEEADFTYLRDTIQTTDGNLSIHLSKLEQAGYIEVTKLFEGKKPVTRCRMTEKGRAAFLQYTKDLRELIGYKVKK